MDIARAARLPHSLEIYPMFSKSLCLFVRVFALLIAAMVFPSSAWSALSSIATTSTWIADGSIYSTVDVGATTYIGGNFTRLGPVTGGGAPVDSSSGAIAATFPKVGGAGATVYAVAPDGAGGWYIGGDFTTVGVAPRYNLAHILADGSVDSSWDPSPNIVVYALAVSGTTLYVGGNFNNIGGQTRNFIAALTAATGVVTAWDPSANGTIRALAVSGDGAMVYAGGDFGMIGTDPISGIAAIGASTGIADTNWVSTSPDGADSSVYSLAVSGSIVYAGGNFTHIGGNSGAGTQPRRYIAALNASDGTPTNWDPNADGIVYAFAVSGSTVYAGGSFTSVNGSTVRNFIAALNAGDGLATAWDPNADSAVSTLAVSGSTVYTGGYFTNIGGQTRNRIAALDTTTGTATTWDPNASSSVRTLAVAGSTVYVGGAFPSIGGLTRNNIAQLDSSGVPTAWDPNANAAVYALAVNGTNVYAGGDFTSVNGSTGRNYIAALNTTTGTATTWNPNADGTVRALAVNSGGTKVYAGGSFITIGGHSVKAIAALNAAAPGLDTWALAGATGSSSITVYALALSSDEATLYAGGSFNNINGSGGAQNSLVALTASSGSPTSWTPGLSGPANGADNIPIYALALSGDGSTLYAGGYFNAISLGTTTSLPRKNIASFKTSDGSLNAWNPSATDLSNNETSSWVKALAVSGTSVYAGGAFRKIGGQSRTGAAEISATSGLATSWNPGADSASIAALAAKSDGSRLYMGGDFTAIGSDSARNKLARFDSPVGNNAPVASSVAISGSAVIGQTLAGSYSYTDTESNVESGSTLLWARNGTNTAVGANAITGATSSTYVVQAADGGRYLFYCVTPKAVAGTSPGTEACSASVNPPPGPLQV